MRLHRRQFIIGPEPIQADDDWEFRELERGRWLSHSPYLPLRSTAHGLVLGFAVGGGHPDGWTGRWILLSGSRLQLDPYGLLGVFFRDGWLSSSPELLRTLQPELPLPAERLVYQSALDWFPPPRSGIAGISRLLPSQMIDIASGEIIHRPLLAENAQASAQELAQLLVESMGALEKVDIALTGGHDSRLVLAAALAAEVDIITHTSVRDGTSYGDVTVPPQLARLVGVPHYTIRAGRVREDLVALVDRHCAFHSAEPARYGLASGHLPDFGRPVASGLGFELGRADNEARPADIDDGLAHKPVHEWAEWVRQHPEPIDWRDRFHWEERVGGWASSVAQMLDLATFERFFPANNRRFLTGLLSVPDSERRSGALQQAMLEHLAPELAAIPMNPKPALGISRRIRRETQLLRREGLRYLKRPGRVLRSHR